MDRNEKVIQIKRETETGASEHKAVSLRDTCRSWSKNGPEEASRQTEMMCQKAALASEHKGDRKEAERNCNYLRTKCAEKAQAADRNRTGLSRPTQ